LASSQNEHDWQRSTDYPSASALLSFLEADLDRGLRLARQAKHERESGRQVALELLKELESVDAEISRWLERARARHIQTRQLGIRAYQFGIALAEVRRLAGAPGEGE
jgi:uncharacterized membrane protein